MSCSESPGTDIHIVYANYGRTSTDVCIHPVFPRRNTSCVDIKSKTVVESLCQKKVSCTLVANNGVFGDPCWGNYKYLEVEFECRHPG